MKKYDCPECKCEMKVDTLQNERWCPSCRMHASQTFLDIIEKLKQQIHDMRNCDNCNQGYCLLDADSWHCCVQNNRKHWKPNRGES